MHEDISDKELIEGIKEGKKLAFQKLYEKYVSRIFNFALSYLKDETKTEELVQNVFIKIWEKKELLDTSKNFKSYIFKISINEIYQFIRKKNIENAYTDYIKNNYKPDEDSTWHTVVLNDMLNKLRTLVQQLPDKQKNIFYLSKEEGLSNAEIAKKLKISKRTVENHLYRAISFLKEQFRSDSIMTTLFIYIWFK